MYLFIFAALLEERQKLGKSFKVRRNALLNHLGQKPSTAPQHRQPEQKKKI